MSLNLDDRMPGSSSAYCTSPAYTDAVNDAQFVRTFGVVALVGAILILIGGAVAVGIGLAVMGFGSSRYYRVLGLSVVVLGIASFLISPFSIIASGILSAGVAWKGFDILGLLSREGKDDPDWQTTRRRAITGIVLSAIGLVIAAGWLTLVLIGMLIRGGN